MSSNVHLVGVDNLSTDSIAAQFPAPDAAIERAGAMFETGATWVDIGAQATNPWAGVIPADEEWSRFELVLNELIPQYPGRISVDSIRPEIHEEIARRRLGPHIWNDISMLNDDTARKVAIRLYHRGAVSKFILSHIEESHGQDFQRAHSEGRLDKAKVVLNELLNRHTQLLLGGVPARDIVLDPGIGFGKTMRLNWELLRFGQILPARMPLMVGFSHKRMLATRVGSDKLLSKDEDYNNLRKMDPRRHRKLAKMVIEAAGDRDVYLRVHEPEWYKGLT